MSLELYSDDQLARELMKRHHTVVIGVYRVGYEAGDDTSSVWYKGSHGLWRDLEVMIEDGMDQHRYAREEYDGDD